MMNFYFICREFERTRMLTRWLIVLAVLALISCIRITSMFSSELLFNYQSNIWDSIFAVVNHPNLLMFAYIPIFLILMSDLLFSSTIEHEYVNLLRLKNRSRWFANKIGLLVINVVVFVLLLVIIPAIVSIVLGYSIGSSWSTYSEFIFSQNYIMAHVPDNFSHVSPFWVVVMYAGLLCVIFTTLGVASIFFVLLMHNGYGGSVITYSILLCNHILMGSGGISKYMFLNNLSPESFSRNENSISVYTAFFIMMILLVIFVMSGIQVCKKRDFLSKEHTSF